MNNLDRNLPFIEDQFIDAENLWRSKRVPVLRIGEYKIGSRITTFLRKNNGITYNLLGVIKWIGRINEMECVGIDLDEPYEYGNSGKLDSKNKFETKSKHGVFTLISNVKIVTNYTRAEIPDYLKTSEDIKIHSTVKVYRVNSSQKIDKCYGTVMWTGHDDKKKYFYGIKLENRTEDGTDGIFSCQRLFNCKNKFGLLVPIGMVKKYDNKNNSEMEDIDQFCMDNEKYLEIIKMLLINRGDVNQSNAELKTVFDIAKSVEDISVLESMILNCHQKMELSKTQSMEMILTEIVELENWDLLFIIIKKAEVDERSNKYLLQLCIDVLVKNMNLELVNEIISICTEKDAILSNGETFMTTLLKSDLPILTIVNIMKREIFDVNKCNLKQETPLIVACQMLMVDVVKMLIKSNCDVKFNNNRAIEVAVLSKEVAINEMNKSKTEDGTKIIELLSEVNDAKEMNLCQICMDKNKNIALNCGHLICSVCEARLILCPFCNVQIRSRLKIFL